MLLINETILYFNIIYNFNIIKFLILTIHQENNGSINQVCSTFASRMSIVVDRVLVTFRKSGRSNVESRYGLPLHKSNELGRENLEHIIHELDQVLL